MIEISCYNMVQDELCIWSDYAKTSTKVETEDAIPIVVSINANHMQSTTTGYVNQ